MSTNGSDVVRQVCESSRTALHDVVVVVVDDVTSVTALDVVEIKSETSLRSRFAN